MVRSGAGGPGGTVAGRLARFDGSSYGEADSRATTLNAGTPTVTDSPDPAAPDHPDLPAGWPPERPVHVSAGLAAVGALGSSLVGGMMLGLLALDLCAWQQGDGFSGQSLVGAGLLGTMALLPGLACWAAGRRMMQQRDDESLFAPNTMRIVAGCLLLIGAAAGWLLGFPTS